MPREKVPESKSNLATLIAIAAAVILGIAFFMTRSKAAGEREESAKAMTVLSNDVAQARASLDETRKVVAGMATTLTARGEELAALSNQLATAHTQLTNANDNFKLVTDNLNKVVADAKAYSETALEEIKKRDQSIKALVDERGELEKRLLTLNSNLTQFNDRIVEVQKKLTDSEKAGEAKAAQIEQLNKLRVYQENRFNDPAALREQIKFVESQPPKPTNGTLLNKANLNLELLPTGNVRLIGHSKPKP